MNLFGECLRTLNSCVVCLRSRTLHRHLYRHDAVCSERLERLERERHRLERERDRKYREQQERAAREEADKRQAELEKRLREEAERRSVGHQM